MKKSTEQQITALFVQAMRTALALIDEKEPAAKPVRPHGAIATGIYPARSKYNPYRAYGWNTTVQRMVYLGMFPSIAACKRAQKAYRAGQQPQDGTRVANHRAPLEVVRRQA